MTRANRRSLIVVACAAPTAGQSELVMLLHRDGRRAIDDLAELHRISARHRSIAEVADVRDRLTEALPAR
jgi:hypothetical protein